MKTRIAALIAALMVSATSASAAVVGVIGLTPVTNDGVSQTFQRENGRLITLWQFDNTPAVGLGTADITISAPSQIMNSFLVVGSDAQIFNLFNGPSPVNAGANPLDPLAGGFTVVANTIVENALWVEWTGTNLLYFNPNFTFSGVSSTFITAEGDPSVIPVPAAMPLLLVGLGALGLMAGRRKTA